MKTKLVHSISIVAGLTVLVAGCKPSANAPDAHKAAAAPSPAAVPTVAAITFSDLPVPPKLDVTPQLLEHGKTIYTQNCIACHGVKGDGKGDAAAFLAPKPRNFVTANYRLRSTPPGRLPTDVDLFRAVSLGMAGTPMPPWRHILNEDDRWAVVEYLKTLSPRFGDTNEDRRTVIQLGTPPERNAASLVEGKALFSKMGCIACHGESGHGDGPSAPSLVDDSQSKIKPRDFSKTGAFKSGYSTKDITRVILTGFNGTPMAGFHGALAETNAWKIAYYVETFARPAPPAALVRASQNFLER